MKHTIFLFTLLCMNYHAFSLDVNFTTNSFKGNNKNYVEFYMKVIGNTVHFKSLDSIKMQSAIEVTLLFKQKNKIVKFDKYTLNSPIFNQKKLRTLDFIDVKRYALDNGEYVLDIKIEDINKVGNLFEKTVNLTINYSENDLEISDIQLIDHFRRATNLENSNVKNGFYLEQHTADLYEIFQKKLTFYVEVYNSDKTFEDDFVIKYYLDKVGDSNGEPFLMRYKRMSPTSVDAMILSLNIADLPTADYYLHLEVRNAKNEFVKGRKLIIKRANPYLNTSLENYEQTAIIGSFIENMAEKQINYCLKAIVMQVHQGYTTELVELLKRGSLINKKRFLYTYWLTKDHNTPETVFYEYMKIVDIANKRFAGTLGRGFESDRGNIFLKYGEPNEIITESADPNAPPYEIWRYNTLDNQQDVKFVFYDPNLAGNNYILLHSTKRGETNNPQWKRELYKNNPQQNGNYIDATDSPDQYGKTIDDNFDN